MHHQSRNKTMSDIFFSFSFAFAFLKVFSLPQDLSPILGRPQYRRTDGVFPQPVSTKPALLLYHRQKILSLFFWQGGGGIGRENSLRPAITEKREKDEKRGGSGRKSGKSPGHIFVPLSSFLFFGTRRASVLSDK